MQDLVFSRRTDNYTVGSSQRNEKKIHRGHLGIEGYWVRARQVMFWLKISSKLVELVSNSQACLENQPSHLREPLIRC